MWIPGEGQFSRAQRARSTLPTHLVTAPQLHFFHTSLLPLDFPPTPWLISFLKLKQISLPFHAFWSPLFSLQTLPHSLMLNKKSYLRSFNTTNQSSWKAKPFMELLWSWWLIRASRTVELATWSPDPNSFEPSLALLAFYGLPLYLTKEFGMYRGALVSNQPQGYDYSQRAYEVPPTSLWPPT